MAAQFCPIFCFRVGNQNSRLRKIAGEIIFMYILIRMFLHLTKRLHAAEPLFFKRFNSTFKYKNYITSVMDDRRMITEYWNSHTEKRKEKYSKNCLTDRLSPTNRTRTGLRSDPYLRTRILATNNLGHNATLKPLLRS
jgi:hypothetical protein